jgi:hypothetical protein
MNVKHTYDSKVEAIQRRVDVVYFSQRTTGNCKIRVGLNVGCSIQCWNRRKKGRLTQSQQQIWNLEKTVQCLPLSTTNATEISQETAWVWIWGTRKIKNALRLFSTRYQRKYTRVQFRSYAVHYTENIRSTQITDTKPTQPRYKKNIFTHDHLPTYCSLESHLNNSYLIIMFSSHTQHAASPIQISTV